MAGLEFLSVGRLTPRKRIRETLEFFAEIIKRRPDAHLTWAGGPMNDADRQYEKEIQSDVVRLGLKDRVTFSGPRPPADLPRAYADADCLLHLSATGSLDKVVLESLASGTPVFSINPATGEAVPSAFWAGDLGLTAAEEAIRRAEQGMTEDERGEIASRFSLEGLIGRIVDRLLE